MKEAPELPEGRELMGLTLYRLGNWKDITDGEQLMASALLATAFTDDGPSIAPAAADRLADYGVRVEIPPTVR